MDPGLRPNAVALRKFYHSVNQLATPSANVPVLPHF